MMLYCNGTPAPFCNEGCFARVQCVVCHRTKAPRGRSVPMEAANGYCDFECRGYEVAPTAPHNWPNEMSREPPSPEAEE